MQEQELSYRKQIARNLRTQYVEGIYRPKYYTVTLKSKLRSLYGLLFAFHSNNDRIFSHFGDIQRQGIA